MRGRPVSGSPVRLTVPEEPAQLLWLQAFRAAHPDVIVGKGEFDTWEARIPHPAGETVTIRHTLRELLDRLAELLAEGEGALRCPP